MQNSDPPQFWHYDYICLYCLPTGRVVGPNFSYETKNKQKMFPDSSYYKKYNGCCFMYLCEILSKLQVFKVRDFMTFSDGLLIMCNFAYKPHTFIFFYFPLVIITN